MAKAEFQPWMQRYTNEGQNPSIIAKYFPILDSFMMSHRGESAPIALFHQTAVILPQVIAWTSERMIIYCPTIYGGAYLRTYWGALLGTPKLVEGPFLSKIELCGRKIDDLIHANPEEEKKKGNFSTEAWLPKPMHISMLPKAQAQRLFGLIHERDHFWIEEWRTRTYEWYRSKSGTLVLKEGAPDFLTGNSLMPFAPLPSAQSMQAFLSDTPTPQSLPQQMPQPATASPPSPQTSVQQVYLPKAPPEDQIASQLRQVKELFDSGNISEEEYKSMKEEILNSLISS